MFKTRAEKKQLISDAGKSAIKKRAKSFVTMAFIYVLLLQLVFVIIFPFIVKISASFMSWNDMFDRTVTLVPREPTLDNYRTVIAFTGYFKALGGSFTISSVAAIAQTFICAMTGYALAKLKGKLSNIVLFIVLLTIIIPPQVIMIPLFLKFRFFDIFGIFNFFTGKPLSFMDSIIPITILSLTGYGLKNGLYILIMRQFFKGIPEELEEAAVVDGAGVFRSYLRIVLPVSVPMLITIFILSFSWQWTDNFYSGIFFSSFPVLARTTFLMPSISGGTQHNAFILNTYLHTGVLLAIAPIVFLFIIAQKWVVTGLERSGIVG